MRLGFYLSGQHPVERVLPLIARAASQKDERLLVVSSDSEQLERIDKALWEELPEAFLAHGSVGAAHAERQPVLLAQECGLAENGAQLLAIADAQWREDAENFERVLLFFGEEGRQDAREIWRKFDEREDVTREFYELEDGKWVKKA